MKSWWMWLFACALVLAMPPSGAAGSADYLLRPDRVWNGTDDVAHAGWAVLVRSGAIVAVGPANDIDAGDAQAIPLPGTTLVPGLIDLIRILFLHPYKRNAVERPGTEEPEAYRTLEAAQHARDTLLAGFTTLRDLGTEGAGYADVSVKRAIDEGMIPGPRLFVATRAIVATASYGPGPRGFRPDIDLPSGAQEASGVDAVLRAVREQAGHGADWIKVYSDYRVGSDGSAQPTFTAAELKALVDAAHLSGRPVAAHSATDAGMRMAVDAGVDSIEHGYGGSKATFQRMREHGVAYLPTLTAVESTEEYFNHYVPGSPPTPKMLEAEHAFRTALAAGVTIGLRQRCRRLPPRRQLARAGGDGATRHASGGGIARMHERGGEDPAAEGHLGRIAPGCARTWWRSMVIRRRHPGAAHPAFVMKDGAVYRQPPAP
jgi:imidazolonepropionase-like amidohydrolase